MTFQSRRCRCGTRTDGPGILSSFLVCLAGEDNNKPRPCSERSSGRTARCMSHDKDDPRRFIYIAQVAAESSLVEEVRSHLMLHGCNPQACEARLECALYRERGAIVVLICVSSCSIGYSELHITWLSTDRCLRLARPRQRCTSPQNHVLLHSVVCTWACVVFLSRSRASNTLFYVVCGTLTSHSNRSVPSLLPRHRLSLLPLRGVSLHLTVVRASYDGIDILMSDISRLMFGSLRL